ncbi:MAG: hypothetical protein CMJ83_16665 [Planctomycetes bacterium]|nr:hypothetical protein [Planctomycetota bacterium]
MAGLAMAALLVAAFWTIVRPDRDEPPGGSGASLSGVNAAGDASGLTSSEDVRTRRYKEPELGPTVGPSRAGPPVAVRFRVVDGDMPVLDASGYLLVAPRERLSASQRVPIVDGRSVVPVTLHPGFWAMGVYLAGCAPQSQLRFPVIAKRGAEQVIDVPRPGGGVTITGVATDSNGAPVPADYLLLVEVAARFTESNPNHPDQSFRNGFIRTSAGGRFHYAFAGAASDVRAGVARDVDREHELWASFPKPFHRAVLAEGTTWDLGTVAVTDPPLLFEAVLSAEPPKDLTDLFWVGEDKVSGERLTTVNVQWALRPAGAERFVDLGPWGHYTWNGAPGARVRILGEMPGSTAFDAAAKAHDWAWRSPEVLAPGARGVRVHLVRTCAVKGVVVMPGRRNRAAVKVRLLQAGRPRYVLEKLRYGGEFWFPTVVPGLYTVEVVAPLCPPWRKEDVVIAPRDGARNVDLGTITVGAAWTSAEVLLRDGRGSPLPAPVAAVSDGRRGTATFDGEADGKVKVSWPTRSAGPVEIWLWSEGWVPQRFTPKDLPSVLTLDRGTFLSIDPGFDPSDLAFPGPLTVRLAATSKTRVARSRLPTQRSDITSALDLAMGPFPPGSCRLALEISARLPSGKRLARSFPVGEVAILAGEDEVEFAIPADVVKQLRAAVSRR